MINQYYLTKKLLTSKFMTDELKEDDTLDSLLFNSDDILKKSTMELYEERVESIKHLTSTNWVEDLTNISGKDITALFNQRDYILQRLSNKGYAEILIDNGHTFIEVLEGLLDVTLTHIENYEKAEKFLTDKRTVTIIVDGNNHNIIKDGKKVGIQTEVEDNIVTLEQCQRIVKNIRKFGYEPKKLHFLLSIYTETPGNDCGDFPEECLLNRDVYYYVGQNTLMIWENGRPVLQNVNGDINDDQDALADCFL